MSRRDEVDTDIEFALRKKHPHLAVAAIARGLADEVDKLQARGDKWADDAVKMAGMIISARTALEDK